MHGGLALSRGLMLNMIERGLPIATELLQPMAAGYFDDLLSWAAIGARTTESQIHREMVSGLALPWASEWHRQGRRHRLRRHAQRRPPAPPFRHGCPRLPGDHRNLGQP